MRIEGGERVAEPQEIRAALLFGGEESAQAVGPAAGLQQHCSVHSVESRGLGDRGLRGSSRKTSASSPGLLFRSLAGCGKQIELAGRGRRPLDAVCEASGAFVTEELARPLAHRQQADNALLGFDDPACPGIEMDAGRQREAVHEVEDQRVSFHRLATVAVFFGVLVVGFLFSVSGRLRVGAIARGGPEGPKEQRGQPRVFFERTGATVSRLRFGRAEDLV